MFVVIVGDLDRNSPEDKKMVLNLVEELKQTYNELIIVSAACDKGPGAFVRERCIGGGSDSPDLAFVEVSIKVWVNLNKARLAQVYMSRNPALLEVGEEFHIFSAGRKTGHIPDLIERVKNLGMPLVIYDKQGGKQNFNLSSKSQQNITRSGATISSGDLKTQLE